MSRRSSCGPCDERCFRACRAMPACAEAVPGIERLVAGRRLPTQTNRPPLNFPRRIASTHVAREHIRRLRRRIRDRSARAGDVGSFGAHTRCRADMTTESSRRSLRETPVPPPRAIAAMDETVRTRSKRPQPVRNRSKSHLPNAAAQTRKNLLFQFAHLIDSCIRSPHKMLHFPPSPAPQRLRPHRDGPPRPARETQGRIVDHT